MAAPTSTSDTRGGTIPPATTSGTGNANGNGNVGNAPGNGNVVARAHGNVVAGRGAGKKKNGNGKGAEAGIVVKNGIGNDAADPATVNGIGIGIGIKRTKVPNPLNLLRNWGVQPIPDPRMV